MFIERMNKGSWGKIRAFFDLNTEGFTIKGFKLVEGADYVIHSGGQICHPSNVSTDVQVSIQNIKVTGNILEASYKSDVKGYLDLNSSTGYPDRRYPIKEEEFWDDEPYKSYYGYGWMRRYREILMQHI